MKQQRISVLLLFCCLALGTGITGLGIPVISQDSKHANVDTKRDDAQDDLSQPTEDRPRKAARLTDELKNDPDIQNLLKRLLAEAANPTASEEPANDSQTEVERPKPGPLPGMLAAFQVHGQPMRIAAAGVRKMNTETPIQVTDLIHIGSCTKAMTATMLGRLVDQKKLSFDMTIKQGLPHLIDNIHQDYHHVTLRQLLMHRGGIPREAMWAKQAGQDITERRELIVSEALANKPRNPPGTQFEYSNLGYVIAALFAVHQEKISWEELMQREIFDVLEMRSAGFGPPGTKGKIDQPWGHYALGTAVIPVQRDNPPAIGPAGTVHLTMADWAKFAFQHAGCGEQPIVSKETMNILQSTVPAVAKSKGEDLYSCGWIVTQRGWAHGRVLTHGGSNTVWMCNLWVAPNTKSVYMAVCNAGTGPHVAKYVDQAIAGMIQIQLQE